MTYANENPDPYLENPETGYLNVSGPYKGVILEIRRERNIELVQEGFRYYDIIRWKEGKTFEQPLLGMYFPGPGEYDLNDDGQFDLCLYETDKPETDAKLSQKIGRDIFLSEGSKGYISPHNIQKREWDEMKDYLYPIPINERSLTMGALTQNPGWNDGLNF